MIASTNFAAVATEIDEDHSASEPSNAPLESQVIRAIRLEREALANKSYFDALVCEQKTREVAARYLQSIKNRGIPRPLPLEFIGLFQIEMATLVTVREAALAAQRRLQNKKSPF